MINSNLLLCLSYNNIHLEKSIQPKLIYIRKILKDMAFDKIFKIQIVYIL